MVSPPAKPLLGMYDNGTFPGAPSAWPSGPTTNVANAYFAMVAPWSDFGTGFITDCASAGLIPFVELEPWDYSQNPILFSTITGGSLDSYLTSIGTSIASSGKPCILTFAHEFNVSGQYPWSYNTPGSGPGGGQLTAAEWIAGWTYVRNKIRSTAGGYDLWMWACSADTGGSSTTSPSPWWPSSALPDMVGIDGYEALEGSPVTFNGVFAAALADIRALGWSGDIYVSETNLALMVSGGGDSIATFVSDMHAAGMSGILEFEEPGLPSMTSAQWTQYNTAVAAAYGSGGGTGGGTGSYTYTQTLIDGFPGTSLSSSLWITPDNTNGISVSGGTLKIEGLTNYEQVVVETTPYTHNLANGIFALQLSQSGTADPGTMWFLGICDNYVSSGGNAYEFQTFPNDAGGSWYSWAFTGTNVSGDTGSQNILSPSVWVNGNWLGIGNYNLNGTSDVHVYKSADGATWTEIASWTVTGAVNESTAGFYFGTNYNDGAGASTYLATVDNVSWFARSASSGGGGTTPPSGSGPLVQETSGTTTGTSLTLTFPAAVTEGNAVIIALCGYYGGSVSTITLGGSTSSGFAKAATSTGYNAEIWTAYQAAVSSATVVVTTSTAGIAGWAYEVSGNLWLDQSAGTHSSGTAWNSGTTAATIAWPHFTVGLGAVFGTSATVAATGSGWTNGTAYSGITGAATVGGVSGYQQPSGSGTYSYSGTSSASAGWGAVTAAFLVAPAGSIYYGNWGGYIFSEHSSYTGISATFTIPACSGGAYNSMWVGLGDVYQCGIYQTYTSGAPGNSATRPWSWWLPGSGEDWKAASFPTASGDSLTLTMQLTGTDWLMTITNNTESWTYTEVKSVQAVNAGSVSNNGAGPGQWPYPLTQAEVIIEKETSVNLDYGPVTFTGITTVPAATVAPNPVFTVNSAIDQYPGAFTLSGGTGSFTMYYNAAD